MNNPEAIEGNEHWITQIPNFVEFDDATKEKLQEALKGNTIKTPWDIEQEYSDVLDIMTKAAINEAKTDENEAEKFVNKNENSKQLIFTLYWINLDSQTFWQEIMEAIIAYQKIKKLKSYEAQNEAENYIHQQTKDTETLKHPQNWKDILANGLKVGIFVEEIDELMEKGENEAYKAWRIGLKDWDNPQQALMKAWARRDIQYLSEDKKQVAINALQEWYDPIQAYAKWLNSNN